MAIRYFTNKIASKVFKKLSAKQLAAARRNIKKAIAASARKRGKAIAGVARNPLKTYGRSVVRRSTKRRAKQIKQVNLSLRGLRARQPKLEKVKVVQGYVLNLSKSVARNDKDAYSKSAAQLLLAKAKLDKKGGKGVLGYFRAKEVKNLTRQSNSLIAMSKASNAQYTKAIREMISAEGNLAKGYLAISSAEEYAKTLAKKSLTTANIRTVAQDAATTAALGTAAYTGYQEVKKKRKTKKSRK